MVDDVSGSVSPEEADTVSPFAEIGRSGLKFWGGQVDEEFLPQLQGARFYAVMREMADNDSVVGAIMRAIDQLMRKSEWSAAPPEGMERDTEAVDLAEFIEQSIHDMSSSWHDTLSETQTMLPYGWALQEIVLKQRLGGTEDDPPETRSKYDDGRISWRKLPLRAQDTLDEWAFDDNGGVQGMWQVAPPNYDRRFIPIKRSLLFRTTTAKGNPEGKSVMRNAWIDWYFKKRIQQIEGIGIERDLAGLPVGRVPWRMLTKQASTSEKQALEEFKKILRNIRNDDQSAVLWPNAFDENGNNEYDIELLSTGGRRQFDTNAILTRYDQRIAMTVLADFILLGHSKVGTQALSVSKVELFMLALKAWMKSIAEVLNRFAVPRLMKANGFPREKTPELVFSPVEQVDLEEVATFLKNLSDAGAPLWPDRALDEWLRTLVPGMPAPPEELDVQMEDDGAGAPPVGEQEDEPDEEPAADSDEPDVDDDEVDDEDVDDSDDDEDVD